MATFPTRAQEDRWHDMKRIVAGNTLIEHRDTILEGLRAQLDALHDRSDVRYFEKGDWRGDMHRRRLACALVELRAAIRAVEGVRS